MREEFCPPCLVTPLIAAGVTTNTGVKNKNIKLLILVLLTILFFYFFIKFIVSPKCKSCGIFKKQ